MKYEYIELKGKKYCNVYADKSQANGILRFTHEINVTFVLEDDEWKFDSAWHCGVSDMEWKADELDSFEQTFPGLYEEMVQGLKNKTKV